MDQMEDLFKAYAILGFLAITVDGEVRNEEITQLMQGLFLYDTFSAINEENKTKWFDESLNEFEKTDKELLYKKVANVLTAQEKGMAALVFVGSILVSDGDFGNDEKLFVFDLCSKLGFGSELGLEAVKLFERDMKPQKKDGCYVATCVYGSYDCPQVWTLRRFRDDTLGSTWYGRAFIRIYYTVSPTLVKCFGNTKWFKNMWKPALDRMVESLQLKGVENTPYDDKCWR